ncbi:hypothetical protein, partial [Salmonella enterica]|uniref:hypothetical protein n=1 Tax=Salmonella enterica TaxID=28901 RepID=UPI003CED5CD9
MAGCDTLFQKTGISWPPRHAAQACQDRHCAVAVLEASRFGRIYMTNPEMNFPHARKMTRSGPNQV